MKVGFVGLTGNIVYVRPLGDVHKQAPGELLATGSVGGGGNPKPFNKVEFSSQQRERETSVSEIFMETASVNYGCPPFR